MPKDFIEEAEQKELDKINARIPGLMLSQQQAVLKLLEAHRREVIEEVKKELQKMTKYVMKEGVFVSSSDLSNLPTKLIYKIS